MHIKLILILALEYSIVEVQRNNVPIHLYIQRANSESLVSSVIGARIHFSK